MANVLYILVFGDAHSSIPIGGLADAVMLVAQMVKNLPAMQETWV